MNNTLEYLNKYSDNKKYFHFLLTRILEYAQNLNNPQDYIKKNIKNLKDNYPSQIEFIVWDDKGSVLKDLSDRTKYIFILKSLYKTLSEVTKEVKKDYSYKISNLESIKKYANIFRTFFGTIFIPENLKYPLSNSFNSGPFLTELGHGLSYVWFSIKSKISLLCFLSDDLFEKNTGLNKISNILNSKSKSIITGYSICPNYEIPMTNVPGIYKGDLKLALATFENAGDNIFENDKVIVTMSMPMPSVRTFCMFPKTENVWNYTYLRNIYFYSSFSIILLIYLFFYYYFIYRQHFIAIRWKLTVLFLFANLAPIIIISFVANDYIENKKEFSKNEIVNVLEKSVRDFEIRYKSLLDDYSLRLNESVSKIAKIVGEEKIEENEIKELESLFYKFNGSELYLIASNSKIITSKKDYSSLEQLDNMSTFGRATLGFYNKQYEDKPKKGSKADVLRMQESNYFSSFMKDIGTVSDINVGDTTRIYFCYVLGDLYNKKGNYLFIIMWNKDKFQNDFIKNNFETLNKSLTDSQFFIKNKNGESYYGSKEMKTKLETILNENYSLTDKNSGYTNIASKNSIYVVNNGTYLKDWIIFSVYPDTKINNEIKFIIIQGIAGLLTSLLLTIIIIQMLASQFIEPINNLKEATVAIGEQKFSYRLPDRDKDEFGHLNQVYNRVIDGLGDFEVAKIVQESLFPSENITIGNFNIWSKSIITKTLGGDYYDYFKINDEYMGIIIGNVGGQGIAAGLMMAMAKSAVLTATEEIKLNPSLLINRLNKLFFSFENNSKYIKTFQYYVFNINTGSFNYSCAGKCKPAVINSLTKETIPLTFDTISLGIESKVNYEIKKFNLNDKNILVLYTNNLISSDKEANNDLSKIFEQCYDNNREEFFLNMYKQMNNNNINQEKKDFTLIIISRN